MVTVNDTEIPKYAALSHRWGHSGQLKTTRQSYMSHLEEIPYDLLPKTFQDAAHLALMVDVAHLWIDSLCIVQDDTADWERQSVQMGGIFGSALFTVAAIDAWTNTTEDSGLFLKRDMLPVSAKISSTMELSYDRVVRDTENQGPPQFFLRSESVDVSAKSNAAWDDISWDVNYQLSTFDMSIERSEWNSRGWIFQERLMSTRIAYFTKEQIFWECANRTQTQISARNASSGQGSERLHRLLRKEEDQLCSAIKLPAPAGGEFWNVWPEHQKFKVWWLLAERYSQCRLTKTSDKWFAISGLATSLSRVYGTGLHAGIWDAAPGAGLLWQARDGPLKPYDDFRSPSWSWLGMDGPITYPYVDESYYSGTQKVRPLLENPVFEIEEIKGREPEATGESAPLSLRGFSGRVSFKCPFTVAWVSSVSFADFHFREETGRTDDPVANSFFHDLTLGRSALEMMIEYRSGICPPRCRLLNDEDGAAIGWVVLDTDLGLPLKVWCVAVVLRVLNVAPKLQHHVVDLVTLVQDQQEGLFRRVGRGRIVKHGWFDDCLPSKISIC